MIIQSINGNNLNLVRPLYSRAQVENNIISIDDINDSLSLQKILTVDFLKKLGKEPVVHNNGFIVLNITQTKRLHIWGHPDIPQIRETQAIHDHVFGFRSFALVGQLTNVIYELIPNGSDYHIHLTSPSKYEIEPTNVFCDVKPKHITTIAPFGNKHGFPDFYDMKPWDLHKTLITGIAATVIHKTGKLLSTMNSQGQRAFCILPKEEKPYSHPSFSSIDKKVLWKIIKEVLTG